MPIEGTVVAGKKWMLTTGWVLSGLIIAFMGVLPIIIASTNIGMMREGAQKQGYQAHHVAIIVGLEIGCALIYAIPQTAVLGAILLTGYLGGAVATHVRVDDPGWPMAIIIAVIAWLGLFFRDARVRALTPIRRGV